MQKKRKILVVDNNKEVRDLIKKILESTEHYSVQTAQDSKSAIKFLKQESIDLLITDYGMPIMNGYELFKKCITIKPNLLVMFMMEDRSNMSMVEKAKEQGIVSQIYKPFDKEDVIKMVNILFRISSISKNTWGSGYAYLFFNPG